MRQGSRALVSRLAALFVVGAVALQAGAAAAEEGRLSVYSGVEYSSGDYGGSQSYSDVYVPVTLRYARDRLGLRLTVPYLRVELARIDATGALLAGTETQSGLGDVVLGATRYAVLEAADGSFALDLTGKVKLATADADRGLGSGEPDYSLQGEVYKFLPRVTVLGTIGYKVRGEPAGVSFEDGWYADVGASYRLAGATRVGLIIGYREPAIAGNDAVIETTAFVSRRVAARSWMQGYLLRGSGGSSPDWGAGLALTKAW